MPSKKNKHSGFTKLKAKYCPGCVSTWKECSCDSTNNVSMIDSDEQIINFDQVKTQYLNELKVSEECSPSVDAIGEDLRNKLFGSLLIFNDITGGTLEDTRKNVDYIVVYNPEYKNFSSKDEIAFNKARIGRQKCPLLGVDRFPGFCVRNAYLINMKAFEKKEMHCIHI